MRACVRVCACLCVCILMQDEFLGACLAHTLCSGRKSTFFVCVFVHLSVRMRGYLHACVYVCVYVFLCVCLCARTHSCVFLCTCTKRSLALTFRLRFFAHSAHACICVRVCMSVFELIQTANIKSCLCPAASERRHPKTWGQSSNLKAIVNFVPSDDNR